MRVRSEHSWTKHDSFDTETDQQDIAKEPHRRSLVLFIVNKANQSGLVDVAILRCASTTENSLIENRSFTVLGSFRKITKLDGRDSITYMKNM